ncbi:oxidoreductase [Streptomyces albus subsp. albus]|nr:oxidoreductase [Streptomyces albus subsp. albus]
MGKPSLDDLRERVRGDVITPEDADYDDARTVYNAMIDRRPAAVVRGANAGDAMSTVDYARENGLDLAVRGGSHSVPGYGTCDGGVVLDFSRLRGVHIDPAARTARVDPGATWGDFNAAGYAFGLATTGGIISTTGVTGLTLGGGFGHLARGAGLTSDNLRSADVVTADGRFLVANEDEHADLFWALRGGGGNFGVVTSLDFRLTPVKDIYAAMLFYEPDEAATVLRFYRDFITGAPRQLGLFPGFHRAPPLPFIPENRHGDAFLALFCCWAGPLDEGEQMLRPLREVAPVVAEFAGPMPYPALNQAFDGLLPPGLQQYWKGVFVTELTDAAIAAHVEHGPRIPTVNSAVHLYPINGAAHDPAPDATAWSYRDATFAAVIAGAWPDPADNEANTAWVRDYYAAIAPHSEEGGYVNFMAGDDAHRTRANYRGHYDRLADVKRAYDPENLFHLNQNIVP